MAIEIADVHQRQYAIDGYFRVERFAGPTIGDAMVFHCDRVGTADGTERVRGGAFVEDRS